MFVVMMVATHLTTSGKVVAWVGGKQPIAVANGSATQPPG
jgi:hypothetical protein